LAKAFLINIYPSILPLAKASGNSFISKLKLFHGHELPPHLCGGLLIQQPTQGFSPTIKLFNEQLLFFLSAKANFAFILSQFIHFKAYAV
jgi:hypothetical protein